MHGLGSFSEAYQTSAEERERLVHLYNDYELIELGAFDRIDLSDEEKLKQYDPYRLFLFQCEAMVENLAKAALREKADGLRRDLYNVMEDKERQRALWDRIKKTKTKLFEVIRPLERKDKKRDSRAPAEGYFPNEDVVNRELLRGVRNAYEGRRKELHKILKLIFIEKRKTSTPGSEEHKRFSGFINFLSIMQMFYRSRAFARSSHHRVRQTRNTGEAYLTHPDSVALKLLFATKHLQMMPGREPDPRRLIAEGYSHDVVEDTGVTDDELENYFFSAFVEFEYAGKDTRSVRDEAGIFAGKVRRVVELDSEDSELKKLDKTAREAATIEKLRRSEPLDEHQDAVNVKLADRTHNIQTLAGMNPEKRLRKLRDTVEWCRFAADQEAAGIDTLGQAELLAYETEMAYAAFMGIDEAEELLDKDTDGPKMETLGKITDGLLAQSYMQKKVLLPRDDRVLGLKHRMRDALHNKGILVRQRRGFGTRYRKRQ